MNNGQAILNFGSYPGNWSPALQIQSNDNSRYIWMSPMDTNAGANARLTSVGTGFDIYAGNAQSVSFPTAGSPTFPQPVYVGTPTAAGMAATKAYVDSAVSGGSGPWTLSGSNTTYEHKRQRRHRDDGAHGKFEC